MNIPDIERRFTYHSPKEGQPAKYGVLRAEFKALAYKIEELCPDSRERALALTHLETTIMWCNAAISRNE